MATVETIYLGELRTEATHIRSVSKLITDSPTYTMGKGEYFTPTDPVATALGSCMITVMGIAA
ncbi:MAG: OsmC family peroxiredoxin, partial [Bacteroidota bacterium]